MKWNWLPVPDTTTRDIMKVVRPGIIDATVYSLDQVHVLYIFRGSLGISGRIQIPGYSPDLFQPDHLYARTTKHVWKIAAIAWLKPTLFEQSHDSAFVNMRQLPVLIRDRLEQRWYQFTFADQHVEQVPISARCYSLARRAYRHPSIDITSTGSRRRHLKHPDQTESTSSQSTLYPMYPVQHNAGHKPHTYAPISTSSEGRLEERNRDVHDVRTETLKHSSE